MSRMSLHEQKADFLLDLIRRVVANPGNAPRVAKAIARDWNPTIIVARDGSSTFEIKDEEP